jgi:heme exporter protein D
VLANNETWDAPMDQTYELLGIEAESVNTLEDYLKVGGEGGYVWRAVVVVGVTDTVATGLTAASRRCALRRCGMSGLA